MVSEPECPVAASPTDRGMMDTLNMEVDIVRVFVIPR